MKTTVALLGILALSALSPLRGYATDTDPTASYNDQKAIEEYVSGVLAWAGVGNAFHKRLSPARVSCFGNSAVGRPFVERFLSEVSTILNGFPVVPILIADNSLDADVYVVFETRNRISEVQKELSKGSPKKPILFVDITPEGWGDASLRPAYQLGTNRKLTWMLGMSEGLPEITFINSISSRPNEITLQPSGFFEIQRKALRFAYEYVPEGATKNAIRQLVRKNWAKVNVPPSSASSVTSEVALAPATRTDANKVEDFVVKTLTRDGKLTFRKWLKAPAFSCLGDSVKYRTVVEEFCAEVRAVLKGLDVQPIVAADNQSAAAITVLLVPMGQPTGTYPRGPLGFVPNSDIPYRENWNGLNWRFQNALTRWQAQIQVGGPAPNRPDIMHEVIYRECLTAFGIRSYHPGARELDSLLAVERPTQGFFLTLPELDKRLLRFAYEFVPVGASTGEIRRLFKQHWDTIKVP